MRRKHLQRISPSKWEWNSHHLLPQILPPAQTPQPTKTSHASASSDRAMRRYCRINPDILASLLNDEMNDYFILDIDTISIDTSPAKPIVLENKMLLKFRSQLLLVNFIGTKPNIPKSGLFKKSNVVKPGMRDPITFETHTEYVCNFLLIFMLTCCHNK